MKRRRTMLLSVTATSMAAAIACNPGQPVGKVGSPEIFDRDPDANAPLDAEPPPDVAVPVAPTPVHDAGKVGMLDAPPADTVKVGKVAVEKDAGRPIAPPSLHPDRVGTTATVDDRTLPPAVGTTARVPDTKK